MFFLCSYPNLENTMSARPHYDRESIELLAFGHYLRTGHRANVDDLLAACERKFNQNHDETGRFTFGSGAAASRNSSGSRTIGLNRMSSGSTVNSAMAKPLKVADDAVDHANEIVVTATLESRFDAVLNRSKPDAQARPQTSRELGSLSAHYETGGRGVVTVSTGMGRNNVPDRGGVSYGSYQLTSQDYTIDKDHNIIIDHSGGNVGRFLQSDGKQWAIEFAGHAPGSSGFSSVWRQIARRDGAALHAAEHAFTKRGYYDKAANMIKSATDLDIELAPMVLRDVLWSTAVQHGPGLPTKPRLGARRIFIDAIANTDKVVSRNAPTYYETLIRNIYARRATFWPSGRPRYESEMQNALRRLRGN
jgi:hypothetical protein